ncbi:MAG TPA: RodZ domain-containing protein [Burkholderiales bacterium]|nr:RodZ domain-containing protein [Burkholderiales bacterium]
MNDEIQNEETFEPSRPAPGQQLAEAREARGWSVSEIAQRLKFSARQIQALEADAYHALPGVTIVRGMVRSYAKALGLDPQPLVAEIEHRMNTDPLTIVHKPSLSVPLRVGVVKKARPLYVVAMGFVLVFAAAAWWGLRYWNERTVQAPAPAAVEAPEALTESELEVATAPTDVAVEATISSDEQGSFGAVQTAPAGVAGNKRLELQFGADAWVEVKDGEGKMLMAQLNAAQSHATLEGKPPFTLIIGNASTVALKYDGQPVNLAPSTQGDVARLNLN